MNKRNRHIELNGKYLQDAKALLKKQDYPQASEKLWGATAQIIKAIALKRGKKLRSHESISKYVVELSKELNDNSILDYFGLANSLHQNFYENWLAPEMVSRYAKIIEKLIKKLRPLAD
ncbi:MAG: Archaeal PaREP1/PaREP8 family protein [Candidatus Scalindua rubra]|uniref:Archaeal PaREP1/PaREP8 family protein n=1 Tax=Candidatus Scalindua rubra TaxID=1872076 RepID=A0A1E3X5A8_9BACT|nr:MAG: Archaeal PaREP1/PaREP8 family protein [Candidatus Scalindua rubra]